MSGRSCWIRNKTLSDDGSDNGFELLLIVGRERAEGLAHEAGVDGGDKRFEGGGFDEASRMPIVDDRLTESAGNADLAGNGEDDRALANAAASAAAPAFAKVWDNDEDAAYDRL